VVKDNEVFYLITDTKIDNRFIKDNQMLQWKDILTVSLNELEMSMEKT